MGPVAGDEQGIRKQQVAEGLECFVALLLVLLPLLLCKLFQGYRSVKPNYLIGSGKENVQMPKNPAHYDRHFCQ